MAAAHKSFPWIPLLGFALIAVKSTGQSIRNLTVHASAYVDDWNGTAWVTSTTTNRPAPHYRNILLNKFNAGRIDESAVDSDNLVAWRAENIAQDHQLSVVFNSTTLLSALDMVAAAGYAVKRIGDSWGVVYQYDRAAENPVMLLSHRNCERITGTRAFDEVPAGLHVKYFNGDDSSRQRDLFVPNPHPHSIPEYEVMELGNVPDEAAARKLALFYMDQAHYRPITWECVTGLEGLPIQKGSLVGLTVDFVDEARAFGRVRKQVDSQNLVLDIDMVRELSSGNFLSEPDVLNLDNIFQAGDVSVLAVQTSTGMKSLRIGELSGETVTLESSLFSENVEDQHVVIGLSRNPFDRCIVSEITYQAGFRCNVKLVAEAPEIQERLENA